MVCNWLPVGILNALILLFVPTLLLLLVRKTWLTVGIFVVVLAIGAAGQIQNPPVGTVVGVFHAVILVFVMLRFGLSALATSLVLGDILISLPISLDLSAWHAKTPIVVLVLLGLSVIYGFRISLGGRPALDRDTFQD